jgi:hypothetical protein
LVLGRWPWNPMTKRFGPDGTGRCRVRCQG